MVAGPVEPQGRWSTAGDRVVILVFGSTGQVARELAVLPDTECLSREIADLTNPSGCAAVIRQRQPDAVINAAAYTDVDRAETEEELATLINGEAPGAMALVCAELDIPFVTISTDYVFDGNGQSPWSPTDEPRPLGAYGRSKRAGEIAVAATSARWVILRTSWVVSAHGKNFVKTMLRLGTSRDHLSIVADQVGGPTPARDIAHACYKLACDMRGDPAKGGIYHYAGQPNVSWADFAREIFRQAELNCSVEDIPTSDYPTPATRPLNSRLGCADLARDFALTQPDWRSGLSCILSDLRGCDSDFS